MKIAIFGGSGFIGSYLISEWEKAGHQILVYQRKDPDAIFYWNPETGALDYQDLERLDLLVNLAGESLDGRWTEEKKGKILSSRVDTTSFLAQTVASLKFPPPLWVNASAIGYYGDRGSEILDEGSPKGTLFLSDVVDQWEKAAALASGKSRVVFTRFGIVLSPDGGALKKMLTPFKWGLGGKIGTGNQWYSWVSLADIKGAIEHLIYHPKVAGSLNVVSPEPVTALTFTKTLAKVLQRPHCCPLPRWAIELVLGEMGKECLITSERVVPKKLEASGYHFKDTSLEKTLRRLLAPHD